MFNYNGPSHSPQPHGSVMMKLKAQVNFINTHTATACHSNHLSIDLDKKMSTLNITFNINDPPESGLDVRNIYRLNSRLKCFGEQN